MVMLRPSYRWKIVNDQRIVYNYSGMQYTVHSSVLNGKLPNSDEIGYFLAFFQVYKGKELHDYQF